MQKITHGKKLTKTPALGVLWDLKENGGKDVEPGNFTELLRFGIVYFEQTREKIDYVEVPKSNMRIKKGLFGAWSGNASISRFLFTVGCPKWSGTFKFNKKKPEEKGA